MDMVVDLGASRLYRAPGESSHQWVSMDFVRGITVWGVSGSCRHLTPGKESLGLGSRQILPAARCAPDLRGEVGVVLRIKTGVLARLILRRICYVNIFIYQLVACSVAGGLCLFFYCVLVEPEVGVAPGQTGLLWCAAARFSLAGLQHSRVVL